MKKFIAAVAMALSLGAAYADSAEREHAISGQVADVATTVGGLALGATELNPLGLATIPLKYYILARADEMSPGPDKDEAYRLIAAAGYGPAANNVCVILTIATGGGATPGCLLVGLITGIYVYNKE